MRSGTIDLPLHYGKCPRWLFDRMKKLSGLMCSLIIQEYGSDELLNRLSDPLFFCAFSCTIGFDWHSSGTTTTTCGAIKAALADSEIISVCGGKGQASASTGIEIMQAGEKFSFSDSKIKSLKRASNLIIRVDQNCIQAGYVMYHHSFFVDEKGNWAIVQQGLNPQNKYARRYHWLNSDVFTESPDQKIAGQKHQEVLNLVSKESEEVRKISLDIINDNPARLRKYFDGQTTLFDEEQYSILPRHHEIRECNLTKKDWDYLQKAYELQPRKYEDLICLEGLSARKLRALALVSKIIYGKKLDWKDPVKYSFAHGGKDGTPFPIDLNSYQNTISFLREVMYQTEGISGSEKERALKSLASF